MRRWSAWAIAFALAICVEAPARADAPLSAATLAGSGAIGHADGVGSAASFMMPAALAFGPDGTLYVADEAAQRIRTISADGTVATLAGTGEVNASGMWVDGGNRDGAAAQAQFDRPDGIAVASDGTVYVSDLGNHSIRAIAHGTVRTVTSALASPRGLALDRAGTLYVADWKLGVERVAPDGTVAPVVPHGVTLDRPTGIVVGNSGPHIATLFVGDAQGLAEIALPTLEAQRTPAFQSGAEAGRPEVAGDFPFGVPHALAAFDATDVVYSDLRDSAVKFFRLHSYVRYLENAPPEDAPTVGGGPDDASGTHFDAPMGIAIDPSGRVVVADTGNRRIVRLASFGRNEYITPDRFANITYDAKRYRIAVVGSSFTWYFSSGEESIAGKLERDLSSTAGLASRPPQAKYFQIVGLSGEFDLMDNVFALGASDLVVLVISPIDPYGLNLGPDPAAWSPVVRAGLEKTVAAMKAGHVALVVAVLPAAANVSPLESPYLWEQKVAPESTNFEREHAALMRVLAGLDVPVLDLFPAIRAEIASPAHRPLYLSGDIHLTEHGRDLVAGEIARYLQTLAPWGSTR